MEKHNIPAGEPCRDWRDTLADVLMLFTILLAGVVIGIGLCKFCPELWHWLNSGWMETPWIPRATFTVGAVCITVARCM